MLTEAQPLKSILLALDLPVCRNLAITLVAYLSKDDI
jgi:hypothetical protein